MACKFHLVSLRKISFRRVSRFKLLPPAFLSKTIFFREIIQNPLPLFPCLELLCRMRPINLKTHQRFASTDFTALAGTSASRKRSPQIRERGVGQQIIYFYVIRHRATPRRPSSHRRLLTPPLDASLSEIMINRVITIPRPRPFSKPAKCSCSTNSSPAPSSPPDRPHGRRRQTSGLSLATSHLSEREHMDDGFSTIGFRVAGSPKCVIDPAFLLRFPWLLATVAGDSVARCSRPLRNHARHQHRSRFFSPRPRPRRKRQRQSVTVTVQACTAASPTAFGYCAAIRKELFTALMLGSACGSIVGLVAWLWRGTPSPPSVIGGSIAPLHARRCLIDLTSRSPHRFKSTPRSPPGPVALALATS